MRAGYGIFYTQAFYPGWGGGMSLDGFNPQLNFGDSHSGYEPSFYMDNGFPAYSTAPNISSTADNGTGGPQYRPTYANHLSYTQQWNLTVERKLAIVRLPRLLMRQQRHPFAVSIAAAKRVESDALDISGKHGFELGVCPWTNHSQRGECSVFKLGANARLSRNLQTHCGSGFGGYPQYCGSLTGVNENEGTSMYNSFQASFEKKFSAGIYLGVNYTYSHLTTDASSTTQATAGYGGIGNVINPFQGSRNHSISPDDQPNVFSMIAVYDLPFGKGKRFMANSGFASAIVGGWTMSSSIKLTSGLPLYSETPRFAACPASWTRSAFQELSLAKTSWPNLGAAST